MMKNVLMAVLAASSVASHAELVSKDWIQGSGDQMITYDTISKLEWLNVRATVNQTLDAVRRGPWVRQYGFRPATQTEVGTLFTHAGLKDDWFDVGYTQSSEALRLAILLGPTQNYDGGIYAVFGMTATPFTGPDVLPPVGQVFTPQTGKINVLPVDTPAPGKPMSFYGEAHFTGGMQTSVEHNAVTGTFLVRTCRASPRNKC